MNSDRAARIRITAPLASLAYLLLALAFTWPLVKGLTHDVPWDTGDPVLNIWILGWGADHLVRAISGDLQALSQFWNANIFHPEPLTLAYSEHLIAQVLQILPVYAATGNLILCYNLLFLSTFVLAGLGMFLFVRQVTGSAVAGFVAGLVFAFMPMRVPQFSHLQVMSSHWMPFVLFGLRRYLDTGHRRALAGGVAALIAQNLSCGYFLLYFTPFVGAYGLYELSVRQRLREVTAWRDLVVAAVVTVVATVPFLLPYLRLRALGFRPRPLFEVTAFSADVYSYLTAAGYARLAGQTLAIRVFPKAEGDLFPSLAALLLAAIGLLWSVRSAWRQSSMPATPIPPRRWHVRLLVLAAAVYALFALVVLLGFGFTHIGPLEIRVTDLPRMAGFAATLTILTIWAGGRERRFAQVWFASLPAFCALAGAAALILSLGPTAMAMGRPVWGQAPYELLYRYVPGFDGLRVPARYAVVVMVFVSVLAGFGALALARRWRHGAVAAILVGLAVLVEGTAVPIITNGTLPEPGLNPPPTRLLRGTEIPPEYRVVQTLPHDAVLVEFPFGRIGYEVRYMYYSTAHWRRLINGYSGTFPASYEGRLQELRQPETDPERSWAALVAAGVSHAIVHESAYETASQAQAVTGWLARRGARLVSDVPGAKVFALPR